MCLWVSASAAAFAVPAAAQAQSVSQPVVQSLPSRMGVTLNQALARLGQNPRDVDALIDAGNAALAMGDVEAAVGFFRRADQLAPGNGRVKAGLAGALVRGENPFDAIPMFDEAERAGAGDGALAAERGLAYDLVGDNEKAQRYYKLALGRGDDDEVTRRLALSYAMAGDRKASETALNPLLIRQDKASWRTRAFALAILGQVDEAVSIAGRTLPPELSAGISPYLRYMPRLTPAQQAAAANLGHFPRASEIGRDDPRVALFAPKTPRRSAAQLAADTAAATRGQPLADKGRRSASSSRSRAEGRARDRLAANAPTPTPTPSAQSPAPTAQPTPSARRDDRRSRLALNDGPAFTQSAARPRPSRSASAAAPTTGMTAPAPALASPSSAVAARPAIVLPPTAKPAPASAAGSVAPTVPGPSLSIASAAMQGPPAPTAGELPPLGAAASPAPRPTETTIPAPAAAPLMPEAASAPAPASAPAETPRKPASLVEAFKEFLQPVKVDVAPVEGAVDIRNLAPSRQAEARPPLAAGARAAPADAKAAKSGKPAAAAKPPPPSHPSRIWVQIATGRNKAALAFDWRRMAREDAQIFRGKQAFVSSWGQTNRLLTGPFPTEAAANAFMAQLRRADVGGSFLWTSPAGQIVDPIAAK